MPAPKYARRVRSIYADLYVPGSYRAKLTPRVARPWRPRVIAWAGPAAFYQSRFFERNLWYKARIQIPEHIPQLHIIEPTDYYQTLAERLEDTTEKFSNNIGFKKRTTLPKRAELDPEEMERRARRNELFIDIESLEADMTLVTHHFHVFEDLFGQGNFFHNVQNVNINYGESDGSVRYGNVVKSALAVGQPNVSIEAGNNGFTTMLMVNLEGGVLDKSTSDEALGHPQLVHWLVANIEDSKGLRDSGDTIVDYLQPIPFYGTGFHRIAFLFFRHTERLELNDLRLKGNHLFDRIFYTDQFLKRHENKLTPSALRFCQMDWDESCDRTLAKLGMKSPRYWYEWNAPLKPEQKEFPMKPMPFDLYLDMYRDPREVQRTLAREWLERRVHEGEVKKTKYPDIFYNDHKKTMQPWQHQRLIDRNTGTGVYAKLYSDFLNPAFQHREGEQTQQQQQ